MLRANFLTEGVCYTKVLRRRTTAHYLLSAGGRIFSQASIIRKLDQLARIDLRSARGQIRFSRLLAKLDPHVIDSIRIVCCFENLFKARLLLSGCVVHEVDGNNAKDLRDIQRKRPILIRDLKQREGVLGRRDFDFVFKLLKPTTLSWSVLNTRAYRRRIGLPDRLFDCLSDIASRRNTVHFLAPSAVRYSAEVFAELRYVRGAFNRHVVRSHNRLRESLGFPDVHDLKELNPRFANTDGD